MDMSMAELKAYTNRFKEIIGSKAPDDIKDIRLANLMTDLEKAYRIPFLRDEKFEREHPRLMAFYRKVSFSRKLD